MIGVVFLVLTISIFVCGQGNNDHTITITTEPATFFELQSYRDKICKSEPTCHLIKDVSLKEYTTLDYRNCMCDIDCRRHGDCCLDSKHYNATEQKQNFQNFHCSFQESVYMITNCPKSYTDASIRNKCEKSTLPLDNDNIKLIIPVTNVNTRITYGNEYCAQCHGEKNYRLWKETRYCSVKETESIRPDDFQQNYPVANLDNDTSSSGVKLPQYYRVENFTDLTENDTSLPQTNDLSEQSVEATKYIKFNSTSKTFYSSYNNRQFSCSVGRVIPEDLHSAIRRCKIVASECADVSNKTLVEQCQSYTSIVFDNYGSYRNKDCAVCNGVTKSLPGCFSNAFVSHAAASGLFSTKDKVASEVNPCADPSLKDKFCK